MGFPQSYGGAVGAIATGQDTNVSATARPLGINVTCRRVLIVADAGDSVFVVAQGQPVSTGFPIPQMQADGNHRYLELWVNGLGVPWIVGAAGGETIFWLAEVV